MSKMIRVKAIRMGYYGEKRVRPGSVFEIPETKTLNIPVKQKDGSMVRKEVVVNQFSSEWMVKVSKNTPVKEIKMPKVVMPEGHQIPKYVNEYEAADGEADDIERENREEGVL